MSGNSKTHDTEPQSGSEFEPEINADEDDDEHDEVIEVVDVIEEDTNEVPPQALATAPDSAGETKTQSPPQNQNPNSTPNTSQSQSQPSIPSDSEGTPTSLVWHFFPQPDKSIRTQIRNKKLKNHSVKCKICSTLFTFKGGTTNLLNHVKNKHKTEYAEVLQKLDGSVSNNSMNAKDSKLSIGAMLGLRKKHTFSQDTFERLLTRFIVCCDESYRVVESEEFKDFVQYLRCETTMPSADTISRRVQMYYSELKTQVSSILEQVQYLSFTTDIWTSPTAMPYMAVTAHWIEKDWNQISIVLGFAPAPDSHTGLNIKEIFFNVLEDFKVQDKLFCITTDNASNNTTFVQEIPGFNPNEHRIRCLAHIINLSAQSFLVSLVEPLLDQIRKIIKKIRYSQTNLNQLKNLCDGASIRYNKPVLDVKTRWNSTYQMLRVYSLMEVPIGQLIYKLVHDGKMKNIQPLTAEQSELMKSTLRFLKNWNDATHICSGQKYPTLGFAVPIYSILLDVASNAKLDGLYERNESWRNAVNACLDKLDGYYAISSHTLTLATVLDPRFNMEYYKTNYANDSENSEHPDDIQAVVVAEYNRMFPASVASNVIAEEDRSDEDKSLFETKLKLASKKRKIDIGDEILSYCKEEQIGYKKDPLEWWKMHEVRYPRVSLMARKFLAVPASSVASESSFSGARQTVTDFRHSLDEESVTFLQCMKSWMKSGQVQIIRE